MATSGRVEVEFEYAPSDGDAEFDATRVPDVALGVLLELAAHAVNAAFPGYGIHELRFGPPLRLSGPRRCLATVDPATRRLEVSSFVPGAPETHAVKHLVGKVSRFDEGAWQELLREKAKVSGSGVSMAADRVVQDLRASGAVVESVPACLERVELCDDGVGASIRFTDGSWRSYRLHPQIVDCGWLLANFWASRVGIAGELVASAAEAFHVCEPGARVDRVRIVQLGPVLPNAVNRLLLLAEREGQAVGFVHGLAIAGASVATTAGAPARLLGVREIGELAEELRRRQPQQRRACCVLYVSRLLLAALDHEAAEAMLDEVPADVPFRDLGLTSARATAVAAALSDALNRPITATFLFDHPTVGDLADAVLAAFQARAARTDPPRGRSLRSDGSLDESIAVIGVGCRFPGHAVDAEAYWRLLTQGASAAAPLPPSRVELHRGLRAYQAAAGRESGSAATQTACLIDGLHEFDAEFFGISPREARMMDPQHRLLLHTTWEALEDAGIVPGSLEGTSTGVFVGVSSTDYLDLIGEIEAHTGPGNTPSAAAGRIAYFLGLCGPAMIVDTACSSSLAATHLACQSLLTGESELVIVGGVNLLVSPRSMIALAKLGALSASGKCIPFDARADGYVRGEGCGVVVLKPLKRAQVDGNRVLAVIRGSAMNHDGRSNGFTAPSRAAQVQVIRKALGSAMVAPGDVEYVEGHGSGTLLGDAIELQALTDVYGTAHSSERPLWVGSVKGNIGHLEAAAGIAGLIKTILILDRGSLVPQAEVVDPHAAIESGEHPVRVPSKGVEHWTNRSPRLAGVSSFGLTGTNVHVVLERASARQSTTSSQRSVHLLVTSASTEAGLARQADRWAQWLAANPGSNLEDACWTGAVARTHFKKRLAVVGATRAELAAALREAASSRSPAPASADLGPGCLFVFSGHGGHWLGMGRELLAQEPAFADAISECAEVLRPHLQLDLVDELRSDSGRLAGGGVDIVQPTVFAVQVALAQLWKSWGVVPAAVLGHSMGEVGAAYLAGGLSLDDAAVVISARSAALRRIAGSGGMLVTELPLVEASKLAERTHGRVSVAATDSTDTNVLAGDSADLQSIAAELAKRGIFHRMVRIESPSHCAQVDAVRDDLAAKWRGLRPQSPRLPMFSTCAAQLVVGAGLDADYWYRNLRDRVQFAETLRLALADGYRTVIEIGCHPILRGAVQDAFRAAGKSGATVGSLERGKSDLASMYRSLGALYERGMDIDFRKVLGDRNLECVPKYSWQQTEHWIERRTPAAEEPPAVLSSNDAASRVEPRKIEDVECVDDVGDIEWLSREIGAVMRIGRQLSAAENLVTLGLDSLMVQELRSRLWSKLGLVVPVSEFFREPTIEGIARSLDARRKAASSLAAAAPSARTHVDLPSEALLGDGLWPHRVQPASGRLDGVLLTGATGFLGAYLLAELLTQTKAVVYCLVRATDEHAAITRILDNLLAYGLATAPEGRVVPVVGSLEQVRFGLEPEAFDDLASRVDLVLHNGARVDFLLPYSELRDPNVVGTREAIRLACQGRAKSFCFVSSIDVMRAAAAESPGLAAPAPDENAGLENWGSLLTGYAETKWVAEKVVHDLRERGLRTCIFRPGLLVGSRRNGFMPSEEAFVATISAMVQNNVCFEPGTLVLPHLTPVDEAAQFIVRLASEGEWSNVAFHIASPALVTMEQLFQWIRDCGYELQELPYSTWRRLMFDRPSRNPLQPFEQLFPVEQFDQRLLVRVGCEQTLAVLAKRDLRWSSLDREHLRAILTSLRARGRLQPAVGDPISGGQTHRDAGPSSVLEK